MNLLRLMASPSFHKEGVHQSHCSEEGMLCKLERPDNLNHPIYHAAAQIFRNVVGEENVRES